MEAPRADFVECKRVRLAELETATGIEYASRLFGAAFGDITSRIERVGRVVVGCRPARRIAPILKYDGVSDFNGDGIRLVSRLGDVDMVRLFVAVMRRYRRNGEEKARNGEHREAGKNTVERECGFRLHTLIVCATMHLPGNRSN